MAEDNNEKITIAIELEDGSVRTGFVNIEKQAKETGQRISKDGEKVKLIDFTGMAQEARSNIPAVITQFSQMGIAIGVVGGAIFALKSAINLALKGEEIVAIKKEFELLAVSAGLVPAEFEAKLADAARGMADMEDILRSTSSAINNLGDNANRLPDILDLSRRAATSLGLEVTDVYGNMVRAIEAGNVRTLRQYSIFIDSADAIDTYARSLGLVAGDLDQAQRQQAILNATLEAGGKRFNAINTDITPVGNSMKIAREAINDIVDDMALAVASSGPMTKFASILKDIATYKPTSNAATEVADMIAARARLTYEMAELQKNTTAFTVRQNAGIIEDRKKQIAELTDLIQKSGAVIRGNTAESVKASQAEMTAANQTTDAVNGKINAEQRYTVAYRNQLVERAQLAQQLSLVKAGEIDIAQLEDIGQKRIAALQSINNQEKIVRDQYSLELEMLDNQKKAKLIGSEQEYQAQRLQLETNFQQQMAALRSQAINNEVDPLTQSQATMSGMSAVVSGYRSMIEGAQIASSNFANNASKNFKAVGAQMFTSIGTGAANAFAAFGTAIWTGANALEAFADALLASMGQMAIQLGTQFILQGAAYVWAGLPNGVPLMAAGAALAAFGGLLAGMGGSAQGSGMAPDSGGGVSDSGTSETVAIIAPEKLERREPDRSVSLTIEGDVFDTEDTGLRIADILNNAFTKNGVKLVGAT